MVLSGIIISHDNVKLFNDTMTKYRKETNMMRELKWSKVSKGKLNEYKSFVDYFFALNNNGLIHFKSLIVDTQQYDHKKYNNGDKELGFNKMYYQLLLNSFGQNYCKNKHTFVVHMDERTSSYSLNDLRKMLNNACSKKGYGNNEPFRNIQPINSVDSEIIQLNDIVLGSIGFLRNGKSLLASSSEAKKSLAQYIQDKSGIKDFGYNTTFRQQRFSVWNIQLQKKKTP